MAGPGHQYDIAIKNLEESGFVRDKELSEINGVPVYRKGCHMHVFDSSGNSTYDSPLEVFQQAQRKFVNEQDIRIGL